MRNYQTDWLNKWAKYSPKKMILRDNQSNYEWTYSEFNKRVNSIAQKLFEEYQITEGERVAVYSKNNSTYVALFFACVKIGAILVPINYRLTANEIDKIIEDTKPKILIFENEFKNNLQQIERSNNIKNSINISEIDAILKNEDVVNISLPSINYNEENPVMILYTSGSTGLPKGVIITHKMLFWNSINTALRLEITKKDHTLTFAPFYHTGGWNVLLTPFIHHGASQTIMEGFDADEILRLMEREKVTLLFGVPTMLQMMAESPLFDEADLSSTRYIIVGGSPMPIPLIEKYHNKGIAIRQGYGLTEVGPNCFSLSEDDAVRKIGSIGFPNFYIEAKIINELGSESKSNEPGELLLKSPVVTPGYWNNKEATRKTITDGWFNTGDIVRKDDDGFYFVIDRKKNMYISGGENIYPNEIEKILITHSNIKDSAVIGVEDNKWGEVGHAFIITTKSKKILNEDIVKHCKNHLAKYKIPKYFTTLDELPLNPSGKIDKKRLLEIHIKQITNNQKEKKL